jgi:hypothetical protein
MSDIVTISGSPFPSSRSLAILDYVTAVFNWIDCVLDWLVFSYQLL